MARRKTIKPKASRKEEEDEEEVVDDPDEEGSHSVSCTSFQYQLISFDRGKRLRLLPVVNVIIFVYGVMVYLSYLFPTFICATELLFIDL